MSSGKKAGPIEVELKLAFRPQDRDRLERLLSGPPSEPRHLSTTYFDTPDRRLSEQGLTLRVRRAGDGWIQTLKGHDRGPDAAAERSEWEWRIAGERPDARHLAQTPFSALVPCSAELVALFRTDIDRSIRILVPDEGTRIEAAIDEGVIVAGERKEVVHELELELKRGERRALHKLAAQLNADVPLTLSTESKFDRGDALKTGHAVGPSKAAAPDLASTMAAEQAFHDIVGGAVGGMIANLAPTLRGDVEGLHQMRVSLRRLRAHLVLFKPLLKRNKAERINRQLRDLGRVLGEARDWDVLMLETLPGIARKHPDDTWPYVLQQAGDVHRSAARSLVELELRTPEFTALVLSLAACLAEDDGGFLNGSKAVRRPIGRMASELLDRLARKVCKRGRYVRKLDGLELHALRKSMKKLRYGIAALESLFGGKKVKKYLKGCESLQALLGQINDAAVAERLIAQTTKRMRPDLAEPASLLRAWARRRRERKCRKLGHAWTKFSAASPLWH